MIVCWQQLPGGAAPKFAAGDLLIATVKSHDPDLSRSVILLISSDADGAVGLMLNRPNGKAFEGGPVALGVRTLVRSNTKPEGARRIFPGVFVVPGIREDAGTRVYVGYTGWSHEQLRDEIARGLWKVRHGDATVVFDAQPGTLWERMR